MQSNHGPARYHGDVMRCLLLFFNRLLHLRFVVTPPPPPPVTGRAVTYRLKIYPLQQPTPTELRH